jgi:hypothetical protein
MPFRLTYLVAGEAQIDRILSRFGDAVDDLSPAYEEIADDFLEIEERQFLAEGKGNAWAPLNPVYAARKKGPGILRETLALFHSLTRRGAPGAIRRITKDTMELGSSVTSEGGFPYPLAHALGTSKMPARPPIDLIESDKRRWTKMVQRHLVNSLRERTGMPAWRTIV